MFGVPPSTGQLDSVAADAFIQIDTRPMDEAAESRAFSSDRPR
jgi:hypothetical protein